MDPVTLNLNLGGTERTFSYRKGTSDELDIVQALKNSAYNFGRLRQAKETSSLYDDLVGAGKTPLVIDAGANIGAAAVYFAASFPKACIVAIEPQQESFDLLIKNTANFQVECIHSTIAADTGASIAEIYKQRAQTTQPFIVKIDDARCDLSAFAANPDWIDRTPVIIVQLQDYLIPGTKSMRAFVELIAERNRDFVYLDDCVFSVGSEPNISIADAA